MRPRTQTTGKSRWVLLFLAALVTIWATAFSSVTASAATGSGAETRVGASTQEFTVVVAASSRITAGQHLERVLAGPGIVAATGVAANNLRGLSAAERSIAGDGKAIYQSDALGEIRAAHAAGRSAEVSINGTTVLYEPGMAERGMTRFGEHGFVIGRGAFASESELAKTIAHESYRLAFSSSAGGLDAGSVKAETNLAFSFAERVGAYVMGGH